MYGKGSDGPTLNEFLKSATIKQLNDISNY